MPDELRGAKRELGLDAAEFVRQRQADEIKLRSLSLAERGAMIESACRTAAEILRSRIKSGLPAPSPAPWPASTLEFLSKHAPDGRT
ncbi:MAG: hypothetical protein ABI614_05435 [Planctomycetota bacterium]